jgi:glycosyltransferase involved in cell wall biosynthesis
MMWITNVLACLALCYWMINLILYLAERRQLKSLPIRERHDTFEEDLPLVSVIVAAKEEEGTISETVRNLLNQTYPRLEIIAVNDRSEDTTGAKLNELKRWSDAKQELGIPVKVIHIRNLPQGWLGKNHALYQGYLIAKGQLILFTDADVKFTPNTISDSVEELRASGADHLTLTPNMTASTFWLRAFIHYFMFSLSLFIRLWLANDDKRLTHGVGIGAFNLLTRQAYEHIGTHKALAMRPDDDLQLGKRVKMLGLRQRLLVGKYHLEVEWYPTLRSAVRGLEKNIFSGFDYRVSLALGSLLGQLFIFIFPYIAIWWSDAAAAAAFALSIVSMIIIYAMLTRTLSRYPAWEAMLLPFSAAVLLYVMGRSVALALIRKGVYWRGTFYSLDKLRRMRS